MTGPYRALWRRCARGFTLRQKLAILVLGMVYTVSSVDLMPDVIPVLGQIDDLAALALVVRAMLGPTHAPRGRSET